MFSLPVSEGCTPISEKMNMMDMMDMFTENTLPTPPDSAQDATSESEVLSGDTIVSVSTAFYPGVEHTPAPPDFILSSSDNVFFYVHSHRILSVSNNAFDSKWPPLSSRVESAQQDLPLIALPESSPILNLILHVVYALSFHQYAISNEDIIRTVDALKKYGFSPRVHVYPNTHLYMSILSRAPLSPMDMYVLAANHNLEELAVAISPHLLSYDLSELTDEIVERMGAVYLRRLIFLHLGRTDALKRLLLPPTAFHGPTSDCGFEEQRKLMRAWSLATASLAWDARPDLPPTAIDAALGSIWDLLSCQICKQSVRALVKNIVYAWANVKTTI